MMPMKNEQFRTIKKKLDLSIEACNEAFSQQLNGLYAC